MKDKVTIAYAYGPQNAGDFALNLGTINLLSEIYDKENIYMISRFGEDSPDFKESKRLLKEYEPDVTLLPCFFDVDRYRQNKIERSLNIGKAAARYLYYAKIPGTGAFSRLPAIKAINESEFVFCNSGNLFYWNEYRKDLAYLYGILFPFKYAEKIRRPYGFLPQSIGDIEGTGKLILGDIFKSSEFLTFREPISKKKFQKLFDQEHPVFIDTAFFIDSHDEEKAEEILFKTEIDDDFVAITVRTATLGDLDSLDSKRSENIINGLKELIDHVLENYDYQVLLVCQTKKDIESTSLLESMYEDEDRVKMIEEYNPVVLRSLYEESKLLIAMRLHSAIFSLSAGTPVLGIYKEEWGPKMPGTLELLNMGDYVLDMSSFDPKKGNEAIDHMIEYNESLSQEILENVNKIKTELVNFLKEKV